VTSKKNTVQSKMTFLVPGRPIGAVRTTQRQKFCDKYYLRYQIYKVIIKISFFLALSEWKLYLNRTPDAMLTTSQRRYWTACREQLIETINPAKNSASEYVTVTLRGETPSDPYQ